MQRTTSPARGDKAFSTPWKEISFRNRQFVSDSIDQARTHLIPRLGHHVAGSTPSLGMPFPHRQLYSFHIVFSCRYIPNRVVFLFSDTLCAPTESSLSISRRY